MSGALKVLIAVVVVLTVIIFAVGTTGASVEPQIVNVTLKDYQIGLSQFVVAPGKTVTLVLNNQGEMVHKIVVQPYVSANDSNTIVGPVVGSHTVQSFQLTLLPGVYRIMCTQVTHAEQGMVSAIAAQSPQPVPFRVDLNVLVSVLGLVLGSGFIIFDSLGFRLIRRP